eukprot:Skav221402  [mRNA]  locus=scaffold1352:61794:66652:+ [translate_table: standard]
MPTLGLLPLEPCRDDIVPGSTVNVVGLLVVYDKLGQRLLLRSAVNGFFFTAQCDAPLEEARAYTFFNAAVLTATPRIHLRVQPDDVLVHAMPQPGAFSSASETCAGMGFLGQGLAQAGMTVRVHNELRAPFCEWKQRNSDVKVVHGDVGEIDTLKQMFKDGAGSTQLTGGFSCQPWSGLGDQRGQGDERASALPKILLAAHYLQSHSIMLECVTNAGKDSWVRSLLASFCRQTGFRCSEADLHLQSIAPAQRSRWWCLLCAPVMHCPAIPPLPKLAPMPTVSELLPDQLNWSPDEEAQLRLDQYETRRFNELGGIFSNMVNGKQPLKTALLGWGNQLLSCPALAALFRPESVQHVAVQQFFGRITDVLQLSRAARYPDVQFLPFQSISANPCVHPSDSVGADEAEPLSKPEMVGTSAGSFGDLLTQAVSIGKRKRVEDHVHVTGGLTAFANTMSMHTCHDDGPCTQALQTFFQATDEHEDHEHVVHDMSTTADSFAHDTELLHGGSHAHTGTHTPRPAPVEAIPIAPFSPAVTTDKEGGRATTSVTTPDVLPGIDSTPAVTTDQEGGRFNPGDDSLANGSSPPVATEHKGGSEVIDGALADRVETADGLHQVVLMRPESLIPQMIRINSHSTVGSITVAEDRLASMSNPIKPVDLVGRPLILGDVTHPLQFIHLTTVAEDELINHVPARLCIHDPMPRLHVLYLQGQWVANDEFDFYLELMAKTGQTSVTPTLIVPQFLEDKDLQKLLQTWMTTCMYGAVANRQTASALVVEGHWFPVLITQHTVGIRIRTTPEGKNWVAAAVPADPTILIDTFPLPVRFTADCGFQSVAWLVDQIFGDVSGMMPCPTPMGPHNAIAWRSLFVAHVMQENHMVVATNLAFGGMMQGEPNETLQRLLVDRGVPPDDAAKRAESVFTALGRAPVVSALRGPRAWKDLKALANQAVPKLQLIMAHELSQVIQTRAPGKKFGEKRQKNTHAPKPKIMLTPADIAIPEGIFRDQDGHLVSQLPAQQLHPDATGVMVVTLQEAMPYIKLTSPFSTRPLALAIIDPQESMTQMIGSAVRIPAKCVHTDEPVLLTGRLLQIGTGRIERHQPPNTLKVEEVPNCVLRAVAFRDELETNWEQFLAQPVKEIMRILPELGTRDQGALLDCWDRQFLTLRMQKIKPQEAEQFIVTFRLQDKDICSLLGLSGRHGLYLEPREADGRSPSNSFRVVWLGKMSKAEATVAMRATKPWVCLVRTGQRYGLRVMRTDAPQVHAQHKDSPYLDTVAAQIYIGGPFPWGATRATLVKLFGQWKWEARPLQPRGRSVDGKGLLWEIQAAAAPQFSVYTLEHADVLISAVPAKPRAAASSSQEIQSSERTMDALKKHHKPDPPATEDPLQANDPWGNKQLKTGNGVSAAPKVELAMAQVEQRLKVHVQEQIQAMKSDDKEMGDDDRITALEHKVNTMEQVIQANAQTQQRQATEMAGQIQQLNHKVDSQTTHIQQHMDSKLKEQLESIEALLSKSRKME